MLGVALVFQIISGFILSIHFTNFNAFESVIFIRRESFLGRILRSLHGNGVSLFFFSLFLHIFRGIGFFSFSLAPVWCSGVIIFFFAVIISFLGYSLP